MTFPNQEFPVFDGIAPSWADVSTSFMVPGVPVLEMSDFKSISTGTTLEVGEQRGASGGVVIKRTTGSVKQEASAELYLSGYRKLLRALKASAPKRGNKRIVGVVHFGIVIQFTPPGSEEIWETRIKGCRFMGRDLNPSEGTDAQTVPIKLNPADIVDMIDGEEVGLL